MPEATNARVRNARNIISTVDQLVSRWEEVTDPRALCTALARLVAGLRGQIVGGESWGWLLESDPFPPNVPDHAKRPLSVLYSLANGAIWSAQLTGPDGRTTFLAEPVVVQVYGDLLRLRREHLRSLAEATT
jgi:hypothetical protein